MRRVDSLPCYELRVVGLSSFILKIILTPCLSLLTPCSLPSTIQRTCFLYRCQWMSSLLNSFLSRGPLPHAYNVALAL